MACSALKQQYRDLLCGRRGQGSTGDLSNQIHFIYLRGSREVIVERLKSRDDHFMPSSLLDSQFNDLDEPTENTLIVDIEQSLENIIAAVKQRLLILNAYV